MRIEAECIPCLMKRVLFQAGLDGSGAEYESVVAAVKACADNIRRDMHSVEISTAMHFAAYSVLSTDDPYLGLKLKADEVASEFVRRAQEHVDSSDDPLQAALEVVVVGNIMDFGMGKAIDDPQSFREVFDDLLAQGIDCSDISELKALIDGSGHVLYMFDNCGESVLDVILIRMLRDMGLKVTGVVRGAPILNDVTMDDAVREGLTDELDEIVTTGKFYIGVDWNDIPDDLSEALDSADFIMAKGMANYEASSHVGLPIPIVHVLRAKCNVVSSSMGVPLGSNVVRVVMPRGVSE